MYILSIDIGISDRDAKLSLQYKDPLKVFVVHGQQIESWTDITMSVAVISYHITLIKNENGNGIIYSIYSHV